MLPAMSLTRRTFLKLSAAGATVATLPFGMGCAPDGALSRDVSLAGDDTLVYYADDLSFVVDQRRHTVLVRDAAGAVLTTLGGFGLDGARLNFPADVALHPDRTQVFVADRGNHRIQMYRLDGTYLGQLGTGFGAASGELSYPAGVAFAGGHVLVADSGNHRLQRFALDGRALGTFGHEALSCPVGVTVDVDGRLHVASAGDGSVHLHEADGRFVRRYGTGELFRPRAVLATDSGEVFVGDATRAGVFVYDARGVLVDHQAVGGNYGVRQLSLSPGGAVHAAANLG